jgi:H-type lectin domain
MTDELEPGGQLPEVTPLAVPTRPAPGIPIASDWGGVVHDSIVAQDIQAGQLSVAVSASATGNAPVTFPRPFASAPIVVVAIGNAPGGSFRLVARANAVTASGFSAYLYTGDNTTATVTLTVTWIAYGPRA